MAAMTPGSAKRLAHRYFPDFREQREDVLVWDSWYRGQDQHETLYIPRHYSKNDEYDDLMERSPTPWLALGITSLAQTCYVDGVRRRGTNELLDSWEVWQQNRWDSRQNALYRGVMAHGVAFNLVLPGRLPLTGEKTAVWRGMSAKTTAAWYEYPDDEWAQFGLHAEESYDEDGQPGWTVELYDADATYRFVVKGEGQNLKDWDTVTIEPHDLGVTPLVRYTNMTDLDGRHTGEIEPFIPLAKRIDQTLFDRLIVQRFGAWKVRFITGLQRPANMSETQYQNDLLKMKINDFLVATSTETKFGTLPETSLDGFIKARDADVRDLSAVLQVPPYMFLGLSANMQAESLAAARSALMAKSQERRTNWGEDHEQSFRLSAKIRGNTSEMKAYDLEVKWRDTEVRPLSQAADALGKLAGQVGVPLEILWGMIPNWTDSDVARAKELVETQGFDQLLAALDQQIQGASGQNPLTSPTGIGGQIQRMP